MTSISRRDLLAAAAAAPLAMRRTAAEPQAPKPSGTPPPKYTLTANIELMFTKDVPHAQRIERIAAAGYKAFSFWGSGNKDVKAMLAAQQKTGLACGSITGNGGTGWKTGLTATGYEDAFIKDFLTHIDVAKQFNVKNMICFLGQKQPAVPQEVQHRQIIDGLRKTGDIAAKHDVYFCLEPLNIVESPQMSVLTAKHGFQIVEEVNHPYVRLDFDMYHLQLSEGNLINNLRLGLQKKWIRFVEVGDVPGRKEPGTGETNYENIFKVLREEGFADFVGLEHGTTSTAEHAMDVVRKLAGV
jgi:hydroxypyruvate isomerase